MKPIYLIQSRKMNFNDMPIFIDDFNSYLDIRSILSHSNLNLLSYQSIGDDIFSTETVIPSIPSIPLKVIEDALINPQPYEQVNGSIDFDDMALYMLELDCNMDNLLDLNLLDLNLLDLNLLDLNLLDLNLLDLNLLDLNLLDLNQLSYQSIGDDIFSTEIVMRIPSIPLKVIEDALTEAPRNSRSNRVCNIQQEDQKYDAYSRKKKLHRLSEKNRRAKIITAVNELKYSLKKKTEDNKISKTISKSTLFQIAADHINHINRINCLNIRTIPKPSIQTQFKKSKKRKRSSLNDGPKKKIQRIKNYNILDSLQSIHCATERRRRDKEQTSFINLKNAVSTSVQLTSRVTKLCVIQVALSILNQ
jgi:hypothetical protein